MSRNSCQRVTQRISRNSSQDVTGLPSCRQKMSPLTNQFPTPRAILILPTLNHDIFGPDPLHANLPSKHRFKFIDSQSDQMPLDASRLEQTARPIKRFHVHLPCRDPRIHNLNQSPIMPFINDIQIYQLFMVTYLHNQSVIRDIHPLSIRFLHPDDLQTHPPITREDGCGGWKQQTLEWMEHRSLYIKRGWLVSSERCKYLVVDLFQEPVYQNQKNKIRRPTSLPWHQQKIIQERPAGHAVKKARTKQRKKALD